MIFGLTLHTVNTNPNLGRNETWPSSRRRMNQQSKAVAEAGRRKVIYTLVPRSSLFAWVWQGGKGRKAIK